ncbi:MAG: zinc-binding dehydrogenase [Myxococcota bacterium]
MPTEARIAILSKGERRVHVEAVTLPDPGPHQVVVKIFATGLCHSQIHEIAEERRSDIALGHEATGDITAIGSAVSHVGVGDRVIVGGIARTVDAPTRRPEVATVLRKNGRVAISQGVYTWADHALLDELYVVKVPKETKPDVTCIVGCAVMTGAGAVVNTADVKAGQSVAVFGAGGVGLCTIAAARIVGATPIIAVDLDSDKLDAARRHGATHLIDASREDPVERIRTLTTSDQALDMSGLPVCGVDVAFDCIGTEQTARQILPAARTKPLGGEGGSQAILVGIPDTEFPVSPLDLFVHEKRLTGSLAGSCRPDRDVPRFLEWAARGELDLEALVTRRYALDEINEGIAALAAGQIEGRAIVTCPGPP